MHTRINFVREVSVQLIGFSSHFFYDTKPLNQVLLSDYHSALPELYLDGQCRVGR